MSRIILVFSLFFTAIFSQEIEEFSFIGVTIATHDVSIKSINSNAAEEDFGLRYGSQTISSRTMFSISKGKHLTNYGFEIDRYMSDDLFGMSKLRPYLGLALGRVDYESEYLNTLFKNRNRTLATTSNTTTEETKEEESLDVDSSGYYYGVKAGLTFYVKDNIDADISYYYYNVSDFENVENLQGIQLALHYFY